MDKVAGPYLHTLTSILGDKRSTMLESELQYRVGICRLLWAYVLSRNSLTAVTSSTL